jgi:hypothetical protein
MKRSLYDSEYERVRRQAGMTQPEFPEPREVEIGTPRVLDEDFRQRMAVNAEHEAKKAAERKVHADALSMRANELVRLKEYERAGVDPLPGGVSLALALHMGWKIEQVGDRNVLVAPSANRGTGRRREDYERESS